MLIVEVPFISFVSLFPLLHHTFEGIKYCSKKMFKKNMTLLGLAQCLPVNFSYIYEFVIFKPIRRLREEDKL